MIRRTYENCCLKERFDGINLLIEAMGNRFPDVPLGMSLTVQHDIWTITDTVVLQQLVIEVIKARDLGDFAQVLKTYVASEESLQ